MKACIIGASGYTGRELVSLLLEHPHIELAAITSRALEGKSLHSQLPHLRGSGAALVFSNPSIENLCKQDEINLFFLALPHGTSATFAKPLIESGKKVIDLSADFRLGSTEIYEEFYGAPHPAPELLDCAQYALPETPFFILDPFISFGCTWMLPYKHYPSPCPASKGKINRTRRYRG